MIAAYHLELAEENELSEATIRVYKAAIAAIHRSIGHEGAKGVMGGISRSRGKAQRQARPLTAAALAAVKATAKTRRPVRHYGKQPRVGDKAS